MSQDRSYQSVDNLKQMPVPGEEITNANPTDTNANHKSP